MESEEKPTCGDLFLANVIWIPLGLLVTGLCQYNKAGPMLWFSVPLQFVYLFLFVLISCWGGRISKKKIVIANVVIFVITAPLFFSIFFAVFYPSNQFSFEELQNCQITGQLNANLFGIEDYSILYVSFESNGSSMLGYGCLSDKARDWSNSHVQPYKFYEGGDDIGCGPISEGSSYNKPSNRARLLRTKKKKKKKTYKKPSSSSQSSSSQSSSSDEEKCTSTYTFSQVKLPSWMCLPKDQIINLEPRTCYMTTFNNEEDAHATAKDRKDLRESTSFPLIVFDDPVYFPKGALISLIVFCYLPMLFSLFPIILFLNETFCHSDPNGNENDEIPDQNERSIPQKVVFDPDAAAAAAAAAARDMAKAESQIEKQEFIGNQATPLISSLQTHSSEINANSEPQQPWQVRQQQLDQRRQNLLERQQQKCDQQQEMEQTSKYELNQDSFKFQPHEFQRNRLQSCSPNMNILIGESQQASAPPSQIHFNDKVIIGSNQTIAFSNSTIHSHQNQPLMLDPSMFTNIQLDLKSSIEPKETPLNLDSIQNPQSHQEK